MCKDAAARAHEVTGPPPYSDCGFPSNSIVINPSGMTFPCCLWHGNDGLDDLNKMSFDELWNAKPLRTLRGELKQHAPKRSGCVDCIVHYDMSDPRYWSTYSFQKE